MPHPRRPDPAQGVFETLLVHDGRPVELDAHLARLEASLAALFPDRPIPELRDEIQARAGGVEAGSVKATVAPSGAGARARVESRSSGAFATHRTTNAPGAAIALHAFELPGGLGAHKWADRSLLEGAQAELPDDALPLILDEDGTVLEASRANVFAVRAGALFTPALDGRILPGITRARVLELAAATGVEAHESALRRADLLAADEVFLTGSVRGIEPAASLDGAALAGAGPVAGALATELRRAWLGAPVA
ncbi:MAG TPA: aminotransferase class IV [Solirubrobacterales bacterium]